MLVAALAGVARLDEIAALANAGTLAAFIAVGACLLVLRKREPNRPRNFRTPLAWLVGPLAILGCLYLYWSLPQKTQIWFLTTQLLDLRGAAALSITQLIIVTAALWSSSRTQARLTAWRVAKLSQLSSTTSAAATSDPGQTSESAADRARPPVGRAAGAA